MLVNHRTAELAKTNQLLKREIIDRLEAEAALKASQQRWKIALEAAEMATWDWNILRGEFLWSETIERLWGLASDGFDSSYSA